MGKPKLVLALDHDSGGGALYYDSKLVYDFYSDEPLGYSFGRTNGWDVALENLADMLEIEFDTESRHGLGVKTNHPLDPEEWDVYWPEKLEDAPLDTRTYGPEDDLPPLGDDIILIG